MLHSMYYRTSATTATTIAYVRHLSTRIHIPLSSLYSLGLARALLFLIYPLPIEWCVMSLLHFSSLLRKFQMGTYNLGFQRWQMTLTKEQEQIVWKKAKSRIGSDRRLHHSSFSTYLRHTVCTVVKVLPLHDVHWETAALICYARASNLIN